MAWHGIHSFIQPAIHLIFRFFECVCVFLFFDLIMSLPVMSPSEWVLFATYGILENQIISLTGLFLAIATCSWSQRKNSGLMSINIW